MKNVTIKDIARLAGVSVSTVSLVLSKRGYVGKQTRKKVEKVIAEQDYYPRRSAQQLASRFRGNFGFIVSDIHLSRTEFFYSRVLLGAELEARSKDYYILLTTVGDSFDTRKDLPRFLKSRDVDGIIIAGSVPVDLVKYLSETGIPLVLIDWKVPSIKTNLVMIENFDGAYQAVNHLIAIGRERISFIGGSYYHDSIKERFRGFQQALMDSGMEAVSNNSDLHFLTDKETSTKVGYIGISKLLDSGITPDSIICANDTTAIGCLQALQGRKIAVPDKIAVVGFDDIGYAVHTQPPLTTLHVPKVEMGMQAVRILFDRLENPGARIQTLMVHTDLVVRESSLNNESSKGAPL